MPRTLFVCTYEGCSSTFQHRTKYESHLLMHAGERPYICAYDNCDKSYARLSHLRRHEGVHKPKFSCTVPGCSLLLRTKATLEKHIKHHENKTMNKSKKYKCPECDEAFIKHTTLQIHSFIHTGIKPFACKEPDCDKSFLLPSKLKAHMKYHKGYTCEETNCGKHFPRWSLLLKHKKECHPKTYQCQICDKEFAVMANLKTHILSHSNEREIFKCSVPKCIRFYQAKRHLSDHMKYFHETFTVPCPKEQCHRFFRTEDEMTVHWTRNHTRKQKKVKPSKPPFAEILAGYSKGTKKDLNPQNSVVISEEANVLNQDNTNGQSSPTNTVYLAEKTRPSINSDIDSVCATQSKVKWHYSDLRIEKVM